MKLYREEEILSLLKIHLADEEEANSFVALLTPIELPSDEEIEMKAKNSYNDPASHLILGFVKGATWMRDKIQGDNNEQQ